MTAARQGERSFSGIAELFQWVREQSKSGRVELQGDGESAFVLFEAGDVVVASFGEPEQERSRGRAFGGAEEFGKGDSTFASWIWTQDDGSSSQVPPERRSPGARATKWLIGGPVALLAGLVTWMFLGFSTPQSGVSPSAFEEALAVVEANSIRNRAQADRFDEGRPPFAMLRGRLRDGGSVRGALAADRPRLYNRGEFEENFPLEFGR